MRSTALSDYAGTAGPKAARPSTKDQHDTRNQAEFATALTVA
jgi:hypothetical protein